VPTRQRWMQRYHLELQALTTMKVREPNQANEPVWLISGSLSSRRFCGLGSEPRSQILEWEVFLGACKYSKTKIPIHLLTCTFLCSGMSMNWRPCHAKSKRLTSLPLVSLELSSCSCCAHFPLCAAACFILSGASQWNWVGWGKAIHEPVLRAGMYAYVWWFGDFQVMGSCYFQDIIMRGNCYDC